MSVFSGVGKEGFAWGRAGVSLSPPGVRVLRATPGLTLGSTLSAQPTKTFHLENPAPPPPNLAVTLLLRAELDC